MEHMYPIDAEGPLLGSIATLVGLASVAVFKLRHGSDTPSLGDGESDTRVTTEPTPRDADAPKDNA